ncbi:DUF423 domain-containing protein [Bdellovibrionota bacterium FG-2]
MGNNHTGFVFTGALCAFFAVALGAFGAHALAPVLSERSLAIWQTGVHYQMFHALALLFLAWYSAHRGAPSDKLLTWAGRAFFIGIILFSGSLYALALSEVKILGIITPFGGMSFLAGWALVMYDAFIPLKHKQ